jgi:hypothetical protein
MASTYSLVMSGHAGPQKERGRKRKEGTPPEVREDESVQRQAVFASGIAIHTSRREYEPMYRDVQGMSRLENDVTEMVMTTLTDSNTKVGP